jgi:hypothetical protein
VLRTLCLALFAVATSDGFPVLVDLATASEGEMGHRGVGPEYVVSSSDLISPEAWRDYFAREAWVPSASTVTVTRTGGGPFWIGVFEPSGSSWDWFQVENAFSWQATPQGRWRVQFGRIGVGFFLVDFRALETDPLSALLGAVREEIAAGVMAGPLPRPSAQVLMALLRRSERALDAGHDAIARRSLERFTRMVADLVDRGEVRWATGQLWMNVAEYVTDHMLPQGAHASKAATAPTTWGGIKGLYR